MITWQLSCGHWQSERPGRYTIGAPLPCLACGSLRTVAIGYAMGGGR